MGFMASRHLLRHTMVYVEVSTLSVWRDLVSKHSYTASNEQMAIVQAISSLAQA